jgi:hypothetical protein
MRAIFSLLLPVLLLCGCATCPPAASADAGELERYGMAKSQRSHSLHIGIPGVPLAMPIPLP